MRRRLFLGSLVGTVVATAGCTDEIQGVVGASGSSWESTTVTVGKSGLVDAVDDEDTLIEEGLSYWSANAEQYLGHPATFEYEPQATDPDIQIDFVERIDTCYDHSKEEIAGCAPILADRSVPDGQRIRIETLEGAAFLRHVIKHELGHVLGLDHDDQPAGVMSDKPADWSGEIGQRVSILDGYEAAVETYKRGISSVESARTHMRREEYTGAETDARSARDRFRSARDRFDRERKRAEEIAATGAAEILGSNRDLCDQLAQASDNFATAATAFASGDERRARRYYRDARSIYQKTYDETVISDRLYTELELG